MVEKPKDSLKQFDRAWLTEPNHEFSIDIDFQRRFSRFTHFCHLPAFAGTPILPRVKQDLYANYTEQPEPVVVPPTSEQDYPLIAETVAHWRITSSAIGKAVAAGTALADLTAANPMQRAALAGAAQVADVAFTADKHRLSSAPGSVQFLNTTHQGPGRFSWFTTAANAPINAATFANGYTIETFIKIDPNWKAADHAWCNILTRFGNRGWLPGYAGGDPESPPILFAISNLREVQWEIVPSSSTKQPQTDWSGEIMLNTWYHLAIVNDPKDNSTVLYIEGAPVVRSVIGGNGIASVAASQPWALGCGWWDRAPSDCFLGSIGEVRVVSKPLAPNQWLTARRASA
ncbi:MAG: LamG-like jellyroll fold domain-containing protein [Bradyrhizobium sp.]|nr:LamG-like jellyroll fold domain-containing protein [Bradyrhizobium sp.]